MNKIKLLYDVVKAMRDKNEFQGVVKARGTCDSVEVMRFENEFQKNLATGLTKARINTVLDHDGKQVKHESSTEIYGCFPDHCGGHHRRFHRFHSEHHRCCGGRAKLTKLAFILNALNNLKVEEQADKSVVLTLNLTEIPEDLKAEIHARMAEKHHREMCCLKGVTAVENPQAALTVWLTKNSEVERVILTASAKLVKEGGETKAAELSAEIKLNW
ncbi:MAG: hypothetical protein HPY50_10130 [Firmicutes bacterium]|nr:hypothetical protein [Bacillota bacterium]